MRIGPLSFFIIPFSVVLALLALIAILLAALLPTKACAGEPDMKKVCYVVAEMTAKTCYATGLPGVINDDGKAFLKDVCNAAGDEAQSTCLNGEAAAKFGSMPTCDGVALFTASSIMKGGGRVISALGDMTPESLNKLTGFLRELARESAMGLHGACAETEKRKQEKKPPKNATPLPGEGFDV